MGAALAYAFHEVVVYAHDDAEEEKLRVSSTLPITLEGESPMRLHDLENDFRYCFQLMKNARSKRFANAEISRIPCWNERLRRQKNFGTSFRRYPELCV